MKLFNSTIILISFIAVLSSCNTNKTELKMHKIVGEAQGTYYAISYFDSKNRSLKPQFDSLLSAFDMSASNYKDQSIISKVNRNESVVLDDIFIGNFKLAMRVSRETNGDFDITVRPLVEAWGFGKKKAEDMDSSIVKNILEYVGYHKVKLDSGRIIKTDSRLQLDFDALAQGYSVDVLAKYLESIGVKYYLIDVGGEIYASKSKPDGDLWKVGVETPKDSATYGESLSAVFPLSLKGMATSGNYRKFYVKDGIKYAHTINPHSGYPIASRLLSVTVIAKTAAAADAYATSFMVMGLDKSKKFVSKHPELEVFFIFSDSKGEYGYFTSDGLKDIIE